MWSWLSSFWSTPIAEYSESWEGKNILIFGKRATGKSTLSSQRLPNCERIATVSRSDFDRFLESKLWNCDKPCQVIVELIDRPSYKLLATLTTSRHNNLRFVFESSNSYPALVANMDLFVFTDESGNEIAKLIGAEPYTYSGRPIILERATKRYFLV